jgi:hypothetical protein
MSEDLNQPTGWMALCKCGERVARITPEQLSTSEGMEELSEWMSTGKIIFPVFGKKWPENLRISSCKCAPGDPESSSE